MKKILNWLSREDLNLKNRWWHRLLSIAFIFSFLVLIAYNIILYSASDMFRGGDVQQWKKVGTLSERITSEIKPISAFIKIGEKIGENDRTYVLNDQPDPYYKGVINDVYCSTELSSNYEKIKNARNVDELYVGGSFNRNKVSPEIFTNYIKQNDIRCLTVDAYTTYDTSGQVSGKLSFLEPNKSYQENWSFFEKSTFKTIIYFIEMLPIVLAFSFVVFAGIIVIYYKIFLYIIFGSKKDTE